MAQEGVRDFGEAKRKSAQRLGSPYGRGLPSNVEVEAALRDYQRLFDGAGQSNRLQELRGCALEAMDFFSRFKPRLVGSVLNGTAAQHACVDLHLFADTSEDVVLFLLERQIPYDATERRFRINGDDHACFPAFQFAAGEIGVELVVFPLQGLHQAPWSPVDGRPMQRADAFQLQRLISEAGYA